MKDTGIRIESTSLVKRFGSVTALDGLDLTTGTNWDTIGILGRNGAGKTTFLRILVGLAHADGGRLTVEVDGATLSHADSRLATFVAEESTLIQTITGWRHLGLMEDLNRLSGVDFDHELRDRLIAKFALEEHLGKLVSGMSKGNKRKLELVAALSAGVPLLIADELTEGLDIPSRLVLESVIRELAGSSKRFIVSSHDLSFITSVADTLFIIDHGRCVDAFEASSIDPHIKERVARAFEALAADGPDVGVEILERS